MARLAGCLNDAAAAAELAALFAAHHDNAALVRDRAAAAVVQRVAQTPPWGPAGDFNLVIHLRYGEDGLSLTDCWP